MSTILFFCVCVLKQYLHVAKSALNVRLMLHMSGDLIDCEGANAIIVQTSLHIQIALQLLCT